MNDPLVKHANIVILENPPGFIYMLLKETGFTRVTTTASVAITEVLSLLQQANAEVCLIDLDASFHDQSGLALARQIRADNEKIPLILMTEAYHYQMYRQIRNIRPSSFLRKDLSTLTFYQAIDCALTGKHYPTPSFPQMGYPDRQEIFFKIGDAYKAFHLNQISYFFAKDKMIFAHIEGREYPSNLKLKDLEAELSPLFLRIQKSYLINRNHIEAIHIGNNTVEIAGEHLPIGSTYRNALLKKINIIK